MKTRGIIFVAVLAMATGAAYAQIDMSNAFSTDIGSSNFGSTSNFGSSAFGSSAFGSSSSAFGSGLSNAFGNETYTQNGRIQTRPVGTTAATARASGGQPGMVTTLFLRNPKDLSAILAASDTTFVTPAGEGVVKEVVLALAGSDVSQRQAAEQRLTELGRSAVFPLARLLQDPEMPESHRSAAAVALMRLGPAAVQGFLPLTKDPSASVRLAAVRSLGALGNRVGLRALTEALEDPDAEVRCAAAAALGDIRQTASGVALAKSLQKDVSMDVRVASAESLGRAESRAAVEPLIAGLADKEPRVRAACAKALTAMADLMASGQRGEVGRVKAVDALTAALGDKDVAVRKAAAEGLGRMGDERAVEQLAGQLSDPQVRPVAVKALELIGRDRTRALLSQLASETKDPEVRRAAEDAMSHILER
ncbi:MAG: HEAT repeat domain-containing protein [Planctomycetota bacterium]|nr:HEAT repeat domain-containing protein [Planctomycetota bacterium]